jgi:predicted ATPase
VATLRLVSGIFVTEDLGERPLKGAGDVHLHRALRASGMRSRLDVAAATGLTPLVGRDQELGLLEERFAQVSEGLGQAVLVSGEAGIGKSRLVQAFRERIAERGHSWLECRCSPYTQDSAFFPVLELQRQGLGLGAEVPPRERAERIEAGLTAAGFDLDQAVPLMAGFHGLPLPERYEEPVLSPEGRRKKTLDLLVDWLLRLGSLQPLVLLMEDLHWIDPSTQELLGQILERMPRENVLLLATYRPDFEPPWGAKSHLTPMLLARLTRPQLGDLIRTAARGRDLPEEWVEEIVRRSDGVPLFAEELTKTVLESHPEPPGEGAVPELHIPESLQDSLMARLDALGPVKELAQLGAVLGREFDYALVLAVSPMKEAELQKALGAAVHEELFYQRGTPPEATYLFKHALIRDAAYQSLLRSTRQRHHRRVAETLIERIPAVAEAQPEVVAHHLTESASRESAITWWQRAGEHAAERSANAEAAGHFGKALRLLVELPEGRARDERELELRLALGAPLGAVRSYGDPEVQRGYARARELCARIGESPRLGAALWGLGHVKFNQGELLDAQELADELMRHAQRSGDPDLLLEAHHLLWATSLWKGELRNAEAHISEGISLYRPDRHRALKFLYGAHDPGVCGYGLASLTQWALGRPEQALDRSRQSIALAEELAHPFTLCYAHVYAGILHLLLRDEARAAQCGDVLLALGREQGFPRFISTGALLRAYAAASNAPTQDLVQEVKLTLAQLAGGGERVGATLMLSTLAEAQVRLGDVEEGLQGFAGALAVANQFGERLAEAEIHRQRGEALRVQSESVEALACFERALDVARGQQARSFELRAATSLARLWRDQGKRDAARELLAPVYAWFTEGFDTQDLKEAKALLEELGA